MSRALKARIAEDNLGADVTRGNKDKHPVTAYPMNPWTVVLKLGRRQMAISWWTGLGLTDEPTAQDVLEYLLLEASSVESSHDFKDWCVNRGVDAQIRNEERVYQAQVRQTEKLREFLGDKYDSYLRT